MEQGTPDTPQVNVADAAGEVTRMLRAWSGGDRSVENDLFRIVVPDLHRLARKMTAGERPDNSLQATALMNEAYFKLFRARDRDWENRLHFFRVAAHAMRCLLIDHARARTRSGSKLQIEGLEELLRGRDEHLETAVAIGELLDEMGKVNPDFLTVIEMRYFAGMTLEETVEATGIPRRTVQRRELEAKKWLFTRLQGDMARNMPGEIPDGE